MIEVTPEMIKAFGEAWHLADDTFASPPIDGYRRRAALAAVLAIVERDYAVSMLCADESLVPGVRCYNASGHLGDHEGFLGSGNRVMWSET